MACASQQQNLQAARLSITLAHDSLPSESLVAMTAGRSRPTIIPCRTSCLQYEGRAYADLVKPTSRSAVKRMVYSRLALACRSKHVASLVCVLMVSYCPRSDGLDGRTLLARSLKLVGRLKAGLMEMTNPLMDARSRSP